jgi:hypothetical protein
LFLAVELAQRKKRMIENVTGAYDERIVEALSMAKQKVEICAYCGTAIGPFEAEHAVPRCLWDTKRPSRMVTVPSCNSCNNGYAEDEEYFRTVLVAFAEEGAHPELEKLLAGKVRRSLARNSRLRKEMTKVLGKRPRFTPSGLYAGSGLSFEVDIPRFNRVVEKTVRGLFYYKSQYPLPTDQSVNVFQGNGFWENVGFQDLLAKMEGWAGVGDDVFQCRCARDSSHPDATAWLFIYYKSIGVFAWTMKQDESIVNSENA